MPDSTLTFLPLPSVEFLRECFVYFPKTGELQWRRRPQNHFATPSAHASFNAQFAEKIAGCMRERSRAVKINNQRYKVHRIVWKLITGEEPTDTIDHKSGDPFSNGLNNLRLASMGQQAWNRKIPKTNTSGYRGAMWHRKDKKWRAQICHKGTRYDLGQFNTAEEASAAYEKKARELRGEFYRPPSHG
jgi:hypothetical protein